MSTAEISECGKYRYTLTREIPSVLRWVRPALFIMLNPSTADAELDDPTIRRCISFAAREGCTRLTVVNLFALRSTDPKELRYHDDPEGPCNDGYLTTEIDHARGGSGLIVAAWGAHPFARRRAEYVTNNFGPFVCLGTTKDGSPRHPLYVRGDQALENFPKRSASGVTALMTEPNSSAESTKTGP